MSFTATIVCDEVSKFESIHGEQVEMLNKLFFFYSLHYNIIRVFSNVDFKCISYVLFLFEKIVNNLLFLSHTFIAVSGHNLRNWVFLFL